MNKKNIILLICSIIFLIIAIAIFVFANTQNSDNTNNTANTPKSNSITTEKVFTFYDSDDKSYTLKDFENKPLALILWSSDAENALETIETAIKTYNSSELKDSVNLLIINTKEKNDDIKEIVKNCNFDMPIYYDTNSTAENEYSFSKLPYLVFIKKDGTISNELSPNETEKQITEDSFLANLELLVFDENN